jgi:hypothetical protein
MWCRKPPAVMADASSYRQERQRLTWIVASCAVSDRQASVSKGSPGPRSQWRQRGVADLAEKLPDPAVRADDLDNQLLVRKASTLGGAV